MSGTSIKKIIAAMYIVIFITAFVFAPLTALCDTEAASEDIYNEEENESEEIPYSRGRVLKIIMEEDKGISYGGGSFSTPTQILEVKVIKGYHQGETLRAEYALNFGFGTDYELSRVSEGDEVLLLIEENEEGGLDVYVTEIARDKPLLYLVMFYLFALVLIGRGRGLKAIVTLVFTVLTVFRVLLPALLKGWDPVITSVIVCAAVIGVNLLIVSGFNKKTFSAFIGTTGGVVAAGIIAILFGSMSKLTGLGGDESQMLMYVPQNIHFDFRGLLFAGILISTMGANMDVGMSIASAMHEIKACNPDIKIRELIKAGMNVGRDVMATNSNTLILVYSGGALQLMLLLMAYDTPFYKIINWDIIASEILKAIAGSIGLIFTIPITALAAGAVEERKKLKDSDPGIDCR